MGISSDMTLPLVANVPVQARRRVSADVAWNRLLGEPSSILYMCIVCSDFPFYFEIVHFANNVC